MRHPDPRPDPGGRHQHRRDLRQPRLRAAAGCVHRLPGRRRAAPADRGRRGRASRCCWPTRHGPVAFYPVPYLEPDLVRGAWELPAPASHQQVLTRALAQARADLAARPAGHPIGGAGPRLRGRRGRRRIRTIDRRRRRGVGHRRRLRRVRLRRARPPAQRAGRHRAGPVFADRRCRMRSPRPGSDKSVWLVDLDADGGVGVDAARPAGDPPAGHVRGTLAEILGSRRTDLADAYLSVELTDPVRPLEPMRRLRETLPAHPGRPVGAGQRRGPRRPRRAGRPVGHRGDDGSCCSISSPTSAAARRRRGERALLQRGRWSPTGCWSGPR